MEASGKTLGSEAALAETARLTCDALQVAPFPFAVVRLDGECVAANRVFGKWTEAEGDPTEVVGTSLLTGDDGGFSAALARVSLGDPVNFEASRAPLRGGRRGRYRVQLAPFRVGAMVVGAAVTFQDLTEEQVTADALRAAELWFRTLVESAGDGIGVHRGGTLLYVNPAAVAMLGYESAADVIGRPIMDFVHPDHHDKVRSHIAALAHSGEAPIREETFVRRDGTPVVVEVSASRADLEDGVATFVFFRDVTRTSRMRAEVERAGRMESLSRFAGNVAHDFNNLLAGIHGNLSIARLEIDERSSVASSLEAAQRESQRAADLSQQLLTFSRGADVDPVPLDPNCMVREAVNALERVGDLRGGIRSDLDPGVGTIRMGAAQLQQVVINLLLNAREAVQNGGSIVVRTGEHIIQPREAWPPERAGRWVVIGVEDTGSGMDSATRARIFEPFFSTKRAGQGSGLGLSTVYGLVKQAGGWIDVESEYGKGTRFDIHVPLHEESAQRASTDTPPLEQQGGETVLVCDDESRLAMLTAGLLDQYGYGAVTVPNCEETLAALDRADPRCDVVLLDVNLPDGSALAVLDQMRARGHAQAVILTSGYAEEDVPDELMSNPQVSGYLAKPYSVDRLVETVRRALDRQRSKV